MHLRLRQWLKENVSEAVSKSVRIIYGGKVLFLSLVKLCFVVNKYDKLPKRSICLCVSVGQLVI